MKILIVEDEPAIADTLIYALKTEGLETEWVTTGHNALSIVDNLDIDLVLLDIGLPDMSGFDVCKQMRQSSDLPIIFLTSRTEEIDQVLGLELGADDYVTKPFSPRVLTARIRTRLRQKKTLQKIEDSAGFLINSEGANITLNNENLDLSRYEYRILKLLLEHPGRIYSRSQLMEHAWEEPERSFDRTVDTHIKTIRKKIKNLMPDKDYIRTHRGLGYSYQP